MVGLNRSTIWHDVECGAYAADLPLWRDLAERGHRVTALDVEAELLDELAARAGAAGLEVETVHADARRMDVEEPSFSLVIAPMQLLQVLGGSTARAEVLRAAARALVPGGVFAAAVAALDDAVAPDDAAPPLPDVSELDGWVYSSQPLDVRPEPGGVAVERIRQVVSPRGRLTEERHTQRLDWLPVAELEREAAEAGLEPERRRAIEPTPDHVGSEVVVCRR